ncbi:MAG: FISUMP domain-containing protein [Candidatus Falkowbacteria bacterium]
MFHKFKKAFTLIELLVVIAIIGLLATIAIVALNNARSKARDARRVADVKQIQTALDLYYNDAGHYPLNNIFASGTIFTTSTVTGTTTYMQIVPHAPTPTDGSCNVAANTYSYAVDSEGKAYNIGYCLGGPAGSMAAGYKCATPDGVFNLACAGAATSTNMVGGSGAANFTSCGDQVSYGGINYDTVQIGAQCWMRQNLNIGTMVSGGVNQSDVSASSSPSDFQKYCYGGWATGCDNNNGGLYQWHTVMALPAACDNHDGSGVCNISYPRQGICPSNWHVPSDVEWNTLELATGGDSSSCSNTRYNPSDSNCSAPYWTLMTNDTTHFSATFSGVYSVPNASFISSGTNGVWWSSTANDLTTSWWRGVGTGLYYYSSTRTYVFRSYYGRTSGFSVRCVHD